MLQSIWNDDKIAESNYRWIKRRKLLYEGSKLPIEFPWEKERKETQQQHMLASKPMLKSLLATFGHGTMIYVSWDSQ